MGGRRRDKTQVITDNVEGKQALEQLATKYGVNEKTIRRDLQGMRYVQKISKYKQVTIQMDTTSGGYSSGAAGNFAKWFSSRPNVALSSYFLST